MNFCYPTMKWQEFAVFVAVLAAPYIFAIGWKAEMS